MDWRPDTVRALGKQNECCCLLVLPLPFCGGRVGAVHMQNERLFCRRGFGLPLRLISREWKDRPARSLSYLSYCTVAAVCKLTNEWPVCLAGDDSFTEYARRCGLAYLWCRDWLARTEPTSGYFKLLVITWWRYCRIFDAVFCHSKRFFLTFVFRKLFICKLRHFSVFFLVKEYQKMIKFYWIGLLCSDCRQNIIDATNKMIMFFSSVYSYSTRKLDLQSLIINLNSLVLHSYFLNYAVLYSTATRKNRNFRRTDAPGRFYCIVGQTSPMNIVSYLVLVERAGYTYGANR